MLCCETKYTLENKVLYTITWKEGRAEWIVSSEQSASGAVNAFLKRTNREKSKISGIHVFGFDIEVLHQIRIGEIGESPIAKTTVIDKRKRPLSEVVSVSQQNRRYASFGRDAHKKIKQLILQHRMVSDSGEPIHLRNMELEYEDHIVNIKYNFSSDHLKLDAYVRACDEALLGRDGYRRLAAVEARLIREYQVAQRRIEITKLINVQIPIGTINLDKELNQ
ncbi:hypothetical protein RhiirC2_813548 [Rhizophagus irregularis]|uniref:Uncharacterized protein n=1 Tax=Rhizophagus irregularis TaxID=588596 RepID=A0A2N1NRP8_9GLOM|nr:hypothetical protein RhiirC2_813548 [Rhizophagus irregularis]